ncbi:bifunctional DNA primase/polymerase [Alkalihalobacterium alkalinitrilicum]|uniref:bifunctional DNA primase/polymerase n=1 Tax=Alkalihalobacterium alkalinitrilicum TaxID=427920 RepID=UPI001303E852|nr:bifunctional DNA primase/polymerase [Alkalihalobacterium alkalinitrilicum]
MSDKLVTLHPQEENENIIDTIHECRKRKWSFIPVKQDKLPDFDLLPKENGKKSWKGYQYRLPTPQERIEWESAEGIAVVTGNISGIIILDVDLGGMESLKGKSLPLTPCVRTQSGGFHYYYKYPNKPITSKANILNKVDIRGDGGYALLPNTPKYEWVEGMHIEEIPLADPPEWLLKLVTKKPKEKGEASNEYSLLATPPKKYPKIQTLGQFDSSKLTQWFSSEEVAQRFLDYMGIEREIGQGFKCIIPGHDDSKPSASIYKGDNGVFVYRDWHGGFNEQVLMLPEAYASIHYKKVVTMNTRGELGEKHIGKPEFATWSIRMLVDLQMIDPYPVKAKILPNNEKETVKKVYEGFKLLLGCKWLYTPNEPTPFSWRFARAWCGVSERKCGEAIRYLLAKGYIEIVGETSGRGRKMSLFNIKR